MALIKQFGKPVAGLSPDRVVAGGDYVVNPWEQKVTLQGQAALDLSGANSTTIIPSDLFADEFGGDVLVPVKIWVYADTAITGTPEITVGTTVFALTAHAQDDIAFVEVASGSAAAAIDNDAGAVTATVSTTGGGTARVIVEFLMFK